MSRGIDYGMGLTNIDRETGIRYGVIPIRALGEWAHESFEGVYPEPSCPNCGGEVREARDGEMRDGGPYSMETAAEYWCDECAEGWADWQVQPESPTHHECTELGYEATFGEDGDIFITKSPWKTKAAFCSPCAPGACYLTSPAEDGEWAYCFGPEWFDEGQEMPYVAVRVEVEVCGFQARIDDEHSLKCINAKPCPDHGEVQREAE